jgi:hypothetical protein
MNYSLEAQSCEVDSTSTPTKTPHKRYGIGGTPILAFDSDLGLKYGAAINLFDYGDKFPNYLQYAKLKAFQTTNGTSNLSLTYDNNLLFKKTKFIFESTYTKDVLLNFYGFNGVNSNYNSAITNSEESNYLNPYYYTHQRQLLRFRLDFQKQIKSNNLYLLYGFSFNKYMLDKTDFSLFDVPLGANQSEINTTTLYEDYINSNIITKDEKEGGTFASLKLGITYDSRNNQINCSNGTFIETYLIHSPMLNSFKSFTKHIITFRQYYMIKKIKTLLTYRVSSQQKLNGTIPFYYLPTFHDLSIDNDGVGGAFNLRGVSRNKIAANGFITSNVEIRKEVLSFKALKQNCKVELSAFTDLVYVTQKYEFEKNMDNQSFYNSEIQKVNYTYGLGLYFIYGTNNIISINYGVSPNKDLGTSGLYVGSAFLF